MRLIDRYIFREIISYALLGLAVFTFVFFVPQLVRLMDLVVRHSADAPTVALLFACTLPAVFTFTVPMAVLVGVLIGLGRLSADSELVALQALGFDRRRLLIPVGGLAALTTILTLLMTLVFGPMALARFHAIEGQLAAGQASFQIQPRVFDEHFPGMVFYVQDVDATSTRWRGLFLAQTSGEKTSRLTFAEEAIVIPDVTQGTLQFHLKNGTIHEYTRADPSGYSVSTFAQRDMQVPLSDLSHQRKTELSIAEQPLATLLSGPNAHLRETRLELHRRLSFPVACLVFALLGVSLGVRPHRGGRAVGFILTLLMIFIYYMVFVYGAGLARRGAVSPFLGMWAANLLAGAAGLALVPHMDAIHGDARFFAWIEDASRRFASWRARRRGSAEMRSGFRAATPSSSRIAHSFGFPLLIDVYLLESFFSYSLLFLLGFLLLFHTFTFFELLEDISRNKIPAHIVLSYFLNLTPFLVYQLLPVAELVGVLVTLGVLSKNNEVVAFKASGVSLYRLAVPLLVAGVVLAVGMFILDDTYLPEANQRQDLLRNQIKGRPPRTFFQPRRQWIFGENTKLYNYELFDAYRNLFGGLNVFELDPKTFQLRRRVYATRARWADELQTWVLEQGWVRDLEGSRVVNYIPFKVLELSELSEPPS